jgi:hypothetical protein
MSFPLVLRREHTSVIHVMAVMRVAGAVVPGS